VIEELRPKHKEAKAPSKTKKPKSVAKKKALKKAAKARG
jgi:ATP-dependent RNA helicase SrmB